MNTVELRTPQQPAPQPQPGDVYLEPDSKEVYMLYANRNGFTAICLSSAIPWTCTNGNVALATDGLTYIGPCRITVEPLKGEEKL